MVEAEDGWGGDLIGAFRGNSPFLERLRKISDLRAEQEAALSDLNLGRSAKAAQEAANQSLAEVARKQQEAEELTAAAASLIAQAKRDAEIIRIEADTTLVQARAEAAATVEKANALQRDTETAKRRADSLIKDRETAIAAANKATREADELKTKLQAKLDRIAEVNAEIQK
jgi:hypothetical protein